MRITFATVIMVIIYLLFSSYSGYRSYVELELYSLKLNVHARQRSLKLLWIFITLNDIQWINQWVYTELMPLIDILKLLNSGMIPISVEALGLTSFSLFILISEERFSQTQNNSTKLSNVKSTLCFWQLSLAVRYVVGVDKIRHRLNSFFLDFRPGEFSLSELLQSFIQIYFNQQLCMNNTCTYRWCKSSWCSN